MHVVLTALTHARCSTQLSAAAASMALPSSHLLRRTPPLPPDQLEQQCSAALGSPASEPAAWPPSPPALQRHWRLHPPEAQRQRLPAGRADAALHHWQPPLATERAPPLPSPDLPRARRAAVRALAKAHEAPAAGTTDASGMLAAADGDLRLGGAPPAAPPPRVGADGAGAWPPVAASLAGAAAPQGSSGRQVGAAEQAGGPPETQRRWRVLAGGPPLHAHLVEEDERGVPGTSVGTLQSLAPCAPSATGQLRLQRERAEQREEERQRQWCDVLDDVGRLEQAAAAAGGLYVRGRLGHNAAMAQAERAAAFAHPRALERIAQVCAALGSVRPCGRAPPPCAPPLRAIPALHATDIGPHPARPR